jgi:hypothetical protein
MQAVAQKKEEKAKMETGLRKKRGQTGTEPPNSSLTMLLRRHKKVRIVDTRGVRHLAKFDERIETLGPRKKRKKVIEQTTAKTEDQKVTTGPNSQQPPLKRSGK